MANEKQTSADSGEKVLPSLRLIFEKQVDALRAYGTRARATKNRELAKILGYDESTLSDANGFFVATGLIRRGEGGYVAAPELIEYARSFEWKPENAGAKLASLFSETWFFKALAPRLEIRPFAEEDAITVLAEAAAAGPKERRRLTMLIDYLILAALVRRTEDGKIAVVKNGATPLPEVNAGVKGGDAQMGGLPPPPPPPPPAIHELPEKPDRAKLATLLLENAIDADTPEDVLDAIWKVIKYLKGTRPRTGAE